MSRHLPKRPWISPTLGKLLDFQMKNGTDAIIVCGTTGEASTMSYRERMRTIEFCVDHVDGGCR